MASAHVHIPDMGAAIAAGVVPGAFSADRTVFAFPTLAYASSAAKAATHLWTVRVRLLFAGDYVPITARMLAPPAPQLEGYKAEITIETLQKAGKIRDVVPTYVSEGKNLGKKSATNAPWQALRDALGRYNKQLKKVNLVAPPAVASPGAGAPAEELEEAEGPEQEPPLEAKAAPPIDICGFDPMPPPMLVKVRDVTRDATLSPADFKAGVIVQHKFDGVRFVAFVRDGAVVRYSRAGTEYPGKEHIAAELAPLLRAAPRIAPGEYGTPAEADTERDRRILQAYGALDGAGGGPAPYLDGELYAHGKSLNWISGQARRGAADAGESALRFEVFDVFFPHAKWAGHDMPSHHRQAYLDAFFATAAGKAPHPHVARVANFSAKSMDEVESLARRFLAEGFEGAIARKDSAGYQYGYGNFHSANLIKIKPKLTAEFPVVAFTEGRKGKDVGALIWICEVPLAGAKAPADRRFAVVPKEMSYADRYQLFKCLGQKVRAPGDGPPREVTRFELFVKGLPLTVEFAGLSAKTGKPLQAKALIFRTYEGGPENDPIRRLLADCAEQPPA